MPWYVQIYVKIFFTRTCSLYLSKEYSRCIRGYYSSVRRIVKKFISTRNNKLIFYVMYRCAILAYNIYIFFYDIHIYNCT